VTFKTLYKRESTISGISWEMQCQPTCASPDKDKSEVCRDIANICALEKGKSSFVTKGLYSPNLNAAGGSPDKGAYNCRCPDGRVFMEGSAVNARYPKNLQNTCVSRTDCPEYLDALITTAAPTPKPTPAPEGKACANCRVEFRIDLGPGCLKAGEYHEEVKQAIRDVFVSEPGGAPWFGADVKFSDWTGGIRAQGEIDFREPGPARTISSKISDASFENRLSLGIKASAPSTCPASMVVQPVDRVAVISTAYLVAEEPAASTPGTNDTRDTFLGVIISFCGVLGVSVAAFKVYKQRKRQLEARQKASEEAYRAAQKTAAATNGGNKIEPPKPNLNKGPVRGMESLHNLGHVLVVEQEVDADLHGEEDDFMEHTGRRTSSLGENSDDEEGRWGLGGTTGSFGRAEKERRREMLGQAKSSSERAILKKRLQQQKEKRKSNNNISHSRDGPLPLSVSLNANAPSSAPGNFRSQSERLPRGLRQTASTNRLDAKRRSPQANGRKGGPRQSRDRTSREIDANKLRSQREADMRNGNQRTDFGINDIYSAERSWQGGKKNNNTDNPLHSPNGSTEDMKHFNIGWEDHEDRHENSGVSDQKISQTSSTARLSLI